MPVALVPRPDVTKSNIVEGTRTPIHPEITSILKRDSNVQPFTSSPIQETHKTCVAWCSDRPFFEASWPQKELKYMEIVGTCVKART